MSSFYKELRISLDLGWWLRRVSGSSIVEEEGNAEVVDEVDGCEESGDKGRVGWG